MNINTKRLFVFSLILIVVIISGCTKKEECITINEYNNLISIQSKYKQCIAEFNNYKNNTEREIGKLKENISNKDYLIDNIIQWNKTISNSVWNISYTQAAKSTKLASRTVGITFILDLILGLFLLFSDKLISAERKSFIWFLWFLTIVALAVVLFYLYKNGVRFI